MPESSPENSAELETEKVEAPANELSDVKDTSAESSSAEPKGEKDLLSAVKAALEPKEAPPASKTEGSETDKTDGVLDPNAPKDESDDLTEEERRHLKPKTKARIANLIAARRERDGKIAELEPKAVQFEKMSRFITDAHLSIDEVNKGFGVMSALKNDPRVAYETLKPIFAQLQQMFGDVLPEDLQTAVNEGRITEGHARELATTRTQAAVSTAHLERRNQEDQANEQKRVATERQQKVGTAVGEWETSKGGSDPDWKLKQPRVTEMVRLETLTRQQQDPSFAWAPDEAIKFAEDALKRVNEEFARLRPKPRAINPVTDVASTRAVAKPKTALEAARAALAAG